MSIVGISQGRHHSKGDEWYEMGQYHEAIAEYRKEMDTWYLRLRYNYKEAQSLCGLAQCYGQLGQFEKARETYLQMTAWFHGFYKERAEERLTDLDINLTEVDKYTKQIAEASDDEMKASLIFDLALVYRRLKCSQKAIKQYELIQALGVHEAWKQQAEGFAAGLR